MHQIRYEFVCFVNTKVIHVAVFFFNLLRIITKDSLKCSFSFHSSSTSTFISNQLCFDGWIQVVLVEIHWIGTCQELPRPAGSCLPSDQLLYTITFKKELLPWLQWHLAEFNFKVCWLQASETLWSACQRGWEICINVQLLTIIMFHCGRTAKKINKGNNSIALSQYPTSINMIISQNTICHISFKKLSCVLTQHHT